MAGRRRRRAPTGESSGTPCASSPAAALAALHPLGITTIDDRERTWFRVEAGQGRYAGTGVFDLCVDGSADAWSLARVLD